MNYNTTVLTPKKIPSLLKACIYFGIGWERNGAIEVKTLFPNLHDEEWSKYFNEMIL